MAKHTLEFVKNGQLCAECVCCPERKVCEVISPHNVEIPPNDLIASSARSALRAERFKLAEGEFEKSKLYGEGIVFFKISIQSPLLTSLNYLV